MCGNFTLVSAAENTDEELKSLALIDIERLSKEIDELNDEILPKLLPDDVIDSSDIVLEVK